ncbi:Meiotically up-regulated gene 14 protein [Fusarium oxysporum f. sp. rapae]|uniref:Meiotically up-regulated gene 14 protein n=1 Tax=Fusarium oxysporum f. sp. rapae TaxID=485398 RepID=A0A8J5NJA1_FUSOX|nr:Meiotically up-regulated gene 14 protein [Fusarium oxysporum f. sp. rapae]
MSTETHTQTRLQTNTVEGVGFLSPPAYNFESKYEEREYLKGRLAAAFRIFARFNLNEGAAGHITVRDPVESDTFWVNPFGVDFHLITKSSLLRVSHQGEILDHGTVGFLNKPAFIIHGAIHAARPDVICAAHTHSVYGRAICALGKPLDMLTLEACMFYKVGVVLEGDEDAEIAKSLGDKKAAILKNHGLLTTGATIEETVHWFYTLEKVCQVQLLTDAAARGKGVESSIITDKEAEQSKQLVGTPKSGWFSGRMLFDLIDKETNKDYLV